MTSDSKHRETVETSRFETKDLFFSRTDERGVIASANRVFQFVSAHEWDDLLGAPHKIIRHPNMPKGVFHLVWSYLQSGRPVGGYVQNLAKDGTHYWVFAVMVPVPDGYLSVRLKPDGPLLDKVQSLYRALREREWADDIDPADSANILTEKISELGFESYDDFMVQALSEEVNTRSLQLGRTPDQRRIPLQKMAQAVVDIEDLTGDIVRVFAATKQVPDNMRLQAQRLEGRDGPISVISANHHEMMRTLEHEVIRFCKTAETGGDRINAAIFASNTSELMSEVVSVFRQENVSVQDPDKIAEQERLVTLSDQYNTQTANAVWDLAKDAASYSRMCKDIRRVMTGLEMTRIMCNIERSSIGVGAAGLDETISDLHRCERELAAIIQKIENSVGQIDDASEQINRSKAA